MKVLSDKMRYIILKYETPDDIKIQGIEYYKAVIENSVRTFDELVKWRETNIVIGILQWMPDIENKKG